jgi:hypothetical protein
MPLLTGESSKNRISITGTSHTCITTFRAMPSRHSSGEAAMLSAVPAASPGTTS